MVLRGECWGRSSVNPERNLLPQSQGLRNPGAAAPFYTPGGDPCVARRLRRKGGVEGCFAPGPKTATQDRTAHGFLDPRSSSASPTSPSARRAAEGAADAELEPVAQEGRIRKETGWGVGGGACIVRIMEERRKETPFPIPLPESMEPKQVASV